MISGGSPMLLRCSGRTRVGASTVVIGSGAAGLGCAWIVGGAKVLCWLPACRSSTQMEVAVGGQVCAAGILAGFASRGQVEPRTRSRGRKGAVSACPHHSRLRHARPSRSAAILSRGRVVRRPQGFAVAETLIMPAIAADASRSAWASIDGNASPNGPGLAHAKHDAASSAS